MEKSDFNELPKANNDYEEAVQVSRYVTAIGIFRFLDSQAKQLQAQLDFLATAEDRITALKARLSVVDNWKITARKNVQELESTLPSVMVSRIGRLPDDQLAAAAAGDATAVVQQS